MGAHLCTLWDMLELEMAPFITPARISGQRWWTMSSGAYAQGAAVRERDSIAIRLARQHVNLCWHTCHGTAGHLLVALNCPSKPNRSMSTNRSCVITEVPTAEKKCCGGKMLTLLLLGCATPGKFAALRPTPGEHFL